MHAVQKACLHQTRTVRINRFACAPPFGGKHCGPSYLPAGFFRTALAAGLALAFALLAAGALAADARPGAEAVEALPPVNALPAAFGDAATALAFALPLALAF